MAVLLWFFPGIAKSQFSSRDWARFCMRPPSVHPCPSPALLVGSAVSWNSHDPMVQGEKTQADFESTEVIKDREFEHKESADSKADSKRLHK